MPDRQPPEAIPATPDPRADSIVLRLRKAAAVTDEWARQPNGAVQILHVTWSELTGLLRDAAKELTAKDEELRSLREASAGAQWQPIESAPKNSAVIVYGYGDQAFARWDGAHWRELESAAAVDPTHWMPLPSPPGAPTSGSCLWCDHVKAGRRAHCPTHGAPAATSPSEEVQQEHEK